MSEGIQSKSDRLQYFSSAEIEPPSSGNYDEVLEPNSSDPFSSSLRASAPPRAGALLVEAYARVLDRSTGKRLSPEKVLIEYIKQLVSLSLVAFGYTF